MGRSSGTPRRRGINQSELEAQGQIRLLDLPKAPRRRMQFQWTDAPIWTENKARLIERYLYYFVQITHHGSYIDGFAGPQRLHGGDENWSAKRVLDSSPKWLRHFFLCELKPAPFEAVRAMCDAQAPVGKGKAARTIEYCRGDFNSKVNEILSSKHLTEKEATFCLLDQRTFECHWATVDALARHKKSGAKVELFYFLACAWFDRALSAIKQTALLDAWWGRSDWAKLRGMKDIDRAWAMCDRMIDEFGYKYANPYPILGRQTRGRVMYYMIHATDHDVAPGLMTRAYNRAIAPLETQEQLEMFLAETQAEVAGKAGE